MQKKYFDEIIMLIIIMNVSSVFSSITECSSVLNVLLYCISSLTQIAKFVKPDDTETVHVQIISITECVSWSLSEVHHNYAIVYENTKKHFFKMKEYVGI